MSEHLEEFDQAGAVPFLADGERVSLVLITARSSGRWIFPKGLIDPGETPESTAMTEALEEAGVVGEVVGEPLGCYEQHKWGGVARVEVYPMRVTELLEEWDEQDFRKRMIAPPEKARRLVKWDLVPLIEALEERLAGGLLGEA